MTVSMVTVVALRVGQILNGFLLYVGQVVMTSTTCVQVHYRNRLGLVPQPASALLQVRRSGSYHYSSQISGSGCNNLQLILHIIQTYQLIIIKEIQTTSSILYLSCDSF